jgi:hypothetical protein
MASFGEQRRVARQNFAAGSGKSTQRSLSVLGRQPQKRKTLLV